MVILPMRPELGSGWRSHSHQTKDKSGKAELVPCVQTDRQEVVWFKDHRCCGVSTDFHPSVTHLLREVRISGCREDKEVIWNGECPSRAWR